MGSVEATVPQDYPTILNRRRYLNAFKEVSPLHGSTFYPCSEADIKSVTSLEFARFTYPIFGGYLSREEATVQLERSLLPETPLSKSATEALQRLKNMLTWETHDWGPDLVVKSCLDWDKIFFNGRLKGHIRINWATEEYFRTQNLVSDDGQWRIDGQCVADDISWRWGHCHIKLNADFLLLVPPTQRAIRPGGTSEYQFRYLWATVLHEFCHAYLGILTGHYDTDFEDDAAGYYGGHGKHFQRCIYAVDRRARELLGIGAHRGYMGKLGMPINEYDVQNHIVTPKTSRWNDFKKEGYHRVIQACRHSIRRIVLRDQRYLTGK